MHKITSLNTSPSTRHSQPSLTRACMICSEPGAPYGIRLLFPVGNAALTLCNQSPKEVGTLVSL